MRQWDDGGKHKVAMYKREIEFYNFVRWDLVFLIIPYSTGRLARRDLYLDFSS